VGAAHTFYQGKSNSSLRRQPESSGTCQHRALSVKVLSRLRTADILRQTFANTVGYRSLQYRETCRSQSIRRTAVFAVVMRQTYETLECLILLGPQFVA